MEAALREAGSATVEFDVTLRSWVGFEAVRWQGTTQIQYGQPPVSQTQFDLFELTIPEPTLENVSSTETERYDLVEVGTGGTRYHRSTSLGLPPDQPWLRLDPGQSNKYGSHGALIADPDLGLVDLAFYTGLAAAVSEGHAFSATSDEEETIDGVRTRRYLLNCFPWPESDFCSYPDSAQLTITGFAEPVDVSVPPADQVTTSR